MIGSLPAVRRDRLIDRTAEAIKDYILARRLTTGDRLPSESEFASSLEVSRHILRQAISSLEALGIVRVVHGRGMFVGDDVDSRIFRQIALWIDPTELEDWEFVEVRSAVERCIYDAVIDRATDDDFDRIEALAIALRDAPTPADATRLHGEFHQALLAATGNRFLMSVGSILYRLFWSLAYTAPRVHGLPIDETRKRHVKLVEMLRRRRKEEVSEIIAFHLGVPRGEPEQDDTVRDSLSSETVSRVPSLPPNEG